MEIKILGTGCAKCKQLEKVVREAVDEMGLDATSGEGDRACRDHGVRHHVRRRVSW